MSKESGGVMSKEGCVLVKAQAHACVCARVCVCVLRIDWTGIQGQRGGGVLVYIDNGDEKPFWGAVQTEPASSCLTSVTCSGMNLA